MGLFGKKKSKTEIINTKPEAESLLICIWSKSPVLARHRFSQSAIFSSHTSGLPANTPQRQSENQLYC